MRNPSFQMKYILGKIVQYLRVAAIARNGGPNLMILKFHKLGNNHLNVLVQEALVQLLENGIEKKFTMVVLLCGVMVVVGKAHGGH